MFECFSIIIALTYIYSTIATATISKPSLLLVSFDGFRWDYLSKTDTPNFDRMIKEGAKAKWIKNSYVTKTIPNHFTIVTGLYEETHGAVANSFYDPKYGVFDVEHNKNDSRMFGEFGAEPIWVTAKLQGKTSGCYFWIGCEAEIKGQRPDLFLEYNNSISLSKRIDTVVKWLSEGEGDVPAVDVALLYFNEPDHTGHGFGPESPEVRKKIGELDVAVGEIRDKLTSVDLWGKVNIIFTSDHGMAQADCNTPGTIINLSKYGIQIDEYDFLSDPPVYHVWNKTEGGIERMRRALSTVEHIKINLYTRNNMPLDYHYRNNRRIPPLLIESQPGYVVVLKDDSECGNGVIGYHGSNNSLPDMHPYFIATGPSFKKHVNVDHFRNVDIYPLMCQLLDLKPAPNNGSLDVVQKLITTGSRTKSVLKEHVLDLKEKKL